MLTLIVVLASSILRLASILTQEDRKAVIQFHNDTRANFNPLTSNMLILSYFYYLLSNEYHIMGTDFNIYLKGGLFVNFVIAFCFKISIKMVIQTISYFGDSH